jgi:hypothetical protein
MSEKTEDTELQTADHADVETADEAIETGDESVSTEEQEPAEEQKPEKKKKGSYIIWVLLVFIAVALGGLAAKDQLKPLYQSFAGWIGGFSAQTPATPAPPKLATSEEVQHLIGKIDALQSELMNKQPSNPAEMAEKLSTELSEMSKALEVMRNDSMANLSSELNQVAEEQKTLRASLHEQQQINLQVRLRWISNPASRLPQIKLAWEEISLLGGLSAEQHAKAEEMHNLARDTIQKLNQWQASLQKWADTLAVPVHKDIILKPAQPWLAWAAGQFHLRPAPSGETRKLTRLKNKIENIIGGMTVETWPAENDWQQLRAQLVLRARSQQPKDSTEPVKLNLPKSFRSIQSDINTLQQTAQQWLEQS